MAYPPQPVWIPARPEEERPGGALIGLINALLFALFAFGLPVAVMWLTGKS